MATCLGNRFLGAFVERYCAQHFPGRSFACEPFPMGDGFVVLEWEGIGETIHVVRTARIDARLLRGSMQTPEGVRAIADVLDKAFDSRSEFEKLPWQLFALPP